MSLRGKFVFKRSSQSSSSSSSTQKSITSFMTASKSKKEDPSSKKSSIVWIDSDEEEVSVVSTESSSHPIVDESLLREADFYESLLSKKGSGSSPRGGRSKPAQADTPRIYEPTYSPPDHDLLNSLL
eukprot:TRINITY_DN19614_c0_g1_i1.p1 TRINITY_DN19614_c0_g1~~TRINITY_DN19614_c0_g1_i1.p1  ORF type:complete len:127 (+),score=52.26 TRINITY_DN19614_c0_g1_i1:102-482(+)